MDLDSPIHEAAYRGDTVALAARLAAGEAVDARATVAPEYGLFWHDLTPLMLAARSTAGASVDTVRWLLDHGADPGARSAAGVTAAWYAAGSGLPAAGDREREHGRDDRPARLKLLLDAGLDPNERASGGRTLIIAACDAGDPRRVELLLQRGAEPNPQFDVERERRRRDQWRAATIGQLDIDAEVAEELLPAWNERPSEFEIPLMIAARRGAARCVQLLVDAGAEVDVRDDQGQTPLMAAANAATVQALLANGADPAAVDTMGRDALQHVTQAEATPESNEDEILAAARLLLAQGVDINANLKKAGWTRLYDAAFSGGAPAVRRLLALGADPRHGRSPLSAIAWHANREEDPGVTAAIGALVAAGADPNARDAGGDTPLHCAARGYWHAPAEDRYNSSSDGSNLTAVRALLAHGADPDPVGNWGESPLMLAVADGAADIVAELMAAGADPSRRNVDGDSARDLARKRLKRLRREAEADPDHAAAREALKGLNVDLDLEALRAEGLRNAERCLALVRA